MDKNQNLQDVLPILDKLIDNHHNNNNFLLALTMYVNFYYESIVCEERTMNYLVDSKRLIDKLSNTYPEYTRRQVESMYIALSVCLVILFITNNI